MNLSPQEIERIVQNRLRVERDEIIRKIGEMLVHPFVTEIEKWCLKRLSNWIQNREGDAIGR